MSKKQGFSRITIDVPVEDHKKFKILAAFLGKSMRELVVESIRKHLKSSKTIVIEDRGRK